MLTIETEEFFDSIRKRDLPRLKLLLDASPSLATLRDKDGVSCILLALYYGNPDAANVIAVKKPDLDIFEAAALGKLDRVREIVANDPSKVNSLSPDGLSALALSSFLGRGPVVDFLLAHKADPNLTNHMLGFNALTGAVNEGHRQIIGTLLSHGADPNYRYESGTAAPIITATMLGDAEIVKVLLDHGADPNTTGGDGKTPVKIASEKGQSQIVDLLKKHGAA
jgi:ankyrin repeat protein